MIKMMQKPNQTWISLQGLRCPSRIFDSGPIFSIRHSMSSNIEKGIGCLPSVAKKDIVNPNRAGEGLNQPALFSNGYFSMKKGVWRSKISWLFLIHYELSENQKKFFWFFTVFWGDLEGAGWFSPPPCSQATSRSPALLGLSVKCIWKNTIILALVTIYFIHLIHIKFANVI